MSKILGLDLGTNSIGWAVVDDKENKIIGIGSRIFPVGVDNLGDGEGELSKNASRTVARGTRRQFFRRRIRKYLLLKLLSDLKMCPLDKADFDEWKNSRKFPQHQLLHWIALNPYELRNKALTEKLTNEELGRVFYHLIQRRGFLSNSRSAGKDDGAIYKGNPKDGKIGIDQTKQEIADKTLGAYLYEISPKEGQPFVDELERIRNRYTTRQMYVDEFEKIWEIQAKFNQNLTPDLKEKIGGRKKDGYDNDGVLFHQRPLRSQKHLVGNCTFETNKTKCPISAISFELYRVHQWINTIEYNGKLLNAEERKKAFDFLILKDKPSFKDIRKAIGKIDASFKFNYKDEDKIVGTFTISSLANKKFFGAKWFDFTDKEREDIWHVLYFFEDKSNLKEYAIKNWGFDDEKADVISKFNLKDGYASLSRKAINNILPFLELGEQFDVAVVLGGIKNAFGNLWLTLTDDKKSLILDNVPAIVRSNFKGGFIEHLKKFLVDEFNFSEKQLKKLYHHSINLNTAETLDKLPVNAEADKEIQAIRNPVVITALFEIRKLVNEVIEIYGKPDEIKVELARNLKASKSGRNEERRRQQKLEKENDRVKTELNNLGKHLSHDNMLLYKLWEECKKTCPYTGRSINVTQLFSGEVQIEHIHPWSRSLNDSFMNKTLCFADENRAKGDRTPFEFYGKQGEEKWSEVKERALKLFSDTAQYPNAYQKFKRFVQQKFDDDFASKNLNDTRYISKEAKNYLTKVCDKVNVAPGQMTANLRMKWGLNSILNLEDNTKTRDDHRHHAVDALVMACSKERYLQELTKWNQYKKNPELKDFPMPWENFRADADKAIDAILVSHKKTNNILTVRTHKTEKNGVTHENTGVAARGQLHDKTYYGQNKNCKPDEYVYRVDINSLSFAQLTNIIDANVQKVIVSKVKDCMESHDVEFLDKMILKEKNLDKKEVKSIKEKVDKILKENSFYMPNEGKRYNRLNKIEPNDILRTPVPIKKIRVKKVLGKAEKLNDNIKQFVDPQSNHHVLIYKDESNNLREEVVTFWTVVERKRQKQPVYQLPIGGKEIVTTLHINDMFLLEIKLGIKEEEINWEKPNYELMKDQLYRVQKLTSGDYFFRKHKSSTITDDDYKQIRGFGEGETGWYSFNPTKVKVSVSGKIKKV